MIASNVGGKSLFNVTLVGDRALVGALTQAGPSVRAALVKTVTILSIKLQGHIVRDKLHGQVLGQRSGRLAASIQQAVTQDEFSVFGVVYSAGDVKYAGFWEFGYSGVQSVRDHTRQANKVFGRSVPTYTQYVRAHSRQVNQAARSYMRTGLADMRSEIETKMREAVVGAIRADVMKARESHGP